MTYEAAAALAAAIADALEQQGTLVSQAITAGFQDILLALVPLLITAGIVALAVKKADVFLYIMAGLTVALYSWGLIDPELLSNPFYLATPVASVGLYMVLRGAIYSFKGLK